MDGGRGEEHNNQNQTNTSNKMEQTGHDTERKLQRSVLSSRVFLASLLYQMLYVLIVQGSI